MKYLLGWNYFITAPGCNYLFGPKLRLLLWRFSTWRVLRLFIRNSRWLWWWRSASICNSGVFFTTLWFLMSADPTKWEIPRFICGPVFLSPLWFFSDYLDGEQLREFYEWVIYVGALRDNREPKFILVLMNAVKCLYKVPPSKFNFNWRSRSIYKVDFRRRVDLGVSLLLEIVGTWN